MISSPGEVSDLLRKWKEEERPVFCLAVIGGAERHEFWGKVQEVSLTEVFISGKSAMVSLDLDSAELAEYSELAEARPDLRERFKNFECGITIRSQSVFAVLFVCKSKINKS